ncbi:hypothetical protein FIBSPDRAFT_675379, partial [Athelia psychrophila]
ESILAHNIIDIRHRPGVDNPVADGLSRLWQNRKRTATDGSSWSVLPDWEARSGVRNDILSVNADSAAHEAPPALNSELQERFRGDSFFEPITRHLLGLDAGTSISERRRAMHRAKGFLIERGKLWRLTSKSSDRVARTECIPKAEGFDFAMAAHRKIGHFKSVDALKLHIHETTFWPGMDKD